MTLENLLQEGKLRKIPVDRKQSEDCLLAAQRDLKVARKLIQEDLDWSFSIGYNSILQASRALMFSEGYMTHGEGHHKTIIDYIGFRIGSRHKEEIELFDRMRRKRHTAIYFHVGGVSEFEAKEAIKFAQSFIELIKEKIREQWMK